MSARKPLARPLIDDSLKAELEAIETCIQEQRQRCFLREGVEAEAFRRLVLTPYEVETVEQACERTVALLEILMGGTEDFIAEAFDRELREQGAAETDNAA